MNIVFRQHEGSQESKPLSLDETSSSTLVYIRKNIQRISKEDNQSGNTVELWQYDEAELTPDEYKRYQIEHNTANIEYIAMMSDIELEEVV